MYVCACLFLRIYFEYVLLSGFKQPEDWYKVHNQDFRAFGAHPLLQLYNQSIYKVVSSVYEEHNWVPWRFHKVPNNHWKNPKNQRAYLDWFSTQPVFPTATTTSLAPPYSLAPSSAARKFTEKAKEISTLCSTDSFEERWHTISTQQLQTNGYVVGHHCYTCHHSGKEGSQRCQKNVTNNDSRREQ